MGLTVSYIEVVHKVCPTAIVRVTVLFVGLTFSMLNTKEWDKHNLCTCCSNALYFDTPVPEKVKKKNTLSIQLHKFACPQGCGCL